MKRIVLTLFAFALSFAAIALAEDKPDVEAKKIESKKLYTIDLSDVHSLSYYSIKCLAKNNSDKDRIASVKVIGYNATDVIMLTQYLKGAIESGKSANLSVMICIGETEFRQIKKWQISDVASSINAPKMKLVEASRKAIASVTKDNMVGVRFTVKLKDLSEKAGIVNAKIDCLDSSGYLWYTFMLSAELGAGETKEFSLDKTLPVEIFNAARSFELGY